MSEISTCLIAVLASVVEDLDWLCVALWVLYTYLLELPSVILRMSLRYLWYFHCFEHRTKLQVGGVHLLTGGLE